MRATRVYRYRFAVLAVFCLVNLLIQTLWISYAPVVDAAQHWFGVGGFAIGALSMVFMAAFVPFSLPASWLIDTHGMRRAVGLGAVLMTVGALGRGLAGPHYLVVFAATTLVAIAQPLVLNAWTTLPAHWFPARERASAISLVTFANLLGTALGMVVPRGGSTGSAPRAWRRSSSSLVGCARSPRCCSSSSTVTGRRCRPTSRPRPAAPWSSAACGTRCARVASSCS